MLRIFLVAPPATQLFLSVPTIYQGNAHLTWVWPAMLQIRRVIGTSLGCSHHRTISIVLLCQNLSKLGEC